MKTTAAAVQTERGRERDGRSPAATFVCNILLAILLLQVGDIDTKRTGYRLPQTFGGSSSSSGSGNLAFDAASSGRGLFKKFILWRGLFPQPTSKDNVIVVPQATPPVYPYNPYSNYYPTTTTTTTTIIINGTITNSSYFRNLDEQPATTLPTELTDSAPQSKPKKRITKRHRYMANGQHKSHNPQPRRKKKTRHRHVHRPQQRSSYF